MSKQQIAGHDLVPGTSLRRQIHVDGTSIVVPYNIITGVRPGPTLLLTAGIHSAEYVGVEALIELSAAFSSGPVSGLSAETAFGFSTEPTVELPTALTAGLTNMPATDLSSKLSLEALGGTLIIVPLANPSGFEHRTMSMVYEDGKNLNRVFPGDPEGTAADRLAYALFENLIRHADAYVDLHSGDGYEELMPYVYYLGDTAVEAKARAMADCVHVGYAVRSSCRTGGAYNLASLHGIPSLLLERGQLSLHPREQVDADKADVINIMKHLGMLEGKPETFTKLLLRETELFSPATGCWYPAFHAGDSFREGDTLGVIRNYYGDALHRIVAASDGIILHQCASLNILRDGPMISYGVLTNC